MTKQLHGITLLGILLMLAAPGAAGSAPVGRCAAASGVTLQVLGSGGPIADDGRASTAYLVWVDGKARVLIDAGGGSFLRFGESGADFSDLDFIGISHFHTDHSADLAALLKSGYFSGRKRDLAIAGPGGRGVFPGLNKYLHSLLDDEAGAYGYLGGFLDGTGGLPRLDQREVATESGEPFGVYGDAGSAIQIEARVVPHGIVPALAYRVRIDDQSIVFGGDQNGNDPGFAVFSAGASILVLHMAVPQEISGAGRQLHAPPSVLGEIAQAAGAPIMVLSHLMARSLRDLEGNIEFVRTGYRGTIHVAADLDCITPNDMAPS